MAARTKINSLYLYKKTVSDKNAMAFLDNLIAEREGLTKDEKSEIEDMSTIHRRMYLAGMFLEMISPELTEQLSRAIDPKRATLKHLHCALQFLDLEPLQLDKNKESTVDKLSETAQNALAIKKKKPF